MEKPERSRKLQRTVAIGSVIGFLAGALVVWMLMHFIMQTNSTRTLSAVRESDISSSSGYTLTDPLIGLSSSGPSTEYTALQQQLQSYIQSQQENGLSSASVKFGDTLASEGFTINPDELYDPASLSKIPLMLAYYDLAEQDPSVLSDTITYSGDPDLDADEQIPSPVQLTPGKSYTVEQLIEHMIRNSDNNAEQLLADHLGSLNKLDTLSTLFNDLGIKTNPNNPDDATVGSYSIFLRVLYNATYLDRDYSEQALRLLTESDFSEGIRAGVPGTIEVAQKFGDARIPNTAGATVGAELQNCGIVYYPNHPYLLCIMTKGASVQSLETAIAGISKIVFQNIQTRYPQNQPNDIGAIGS